MIGPGTGVRVYLACGVTDLRKGIGGLAAAAQQVLKQNPASAAYFGVFGGRFRSNPAGDFAAKRHPLAKRFSVPASTYRC